MPDVKAVRDRALWLIVPFALLGLSAGMANAATIVSVSGGTGGILLLNGASGPSGTAWAFFASSWSQTTAYSNVSISATLAAAYGTSTGDKAYLMTQVGPGTTSSEEVASTTFNLPSTSSSPITLFTGLDLGPNTYFLVLASSFNQPAYWTAAIPFSATVYTAPGVSRNSDEIANNGACITPCTPPPPYLPDLSFRTLSGQDLVYSVTGDLAGAPEPTTCALLFAGVLVVAGLRKRVRQRF